MRVLLISHTTQSKSEGHAKVSQIARLNGIDLLALVPHRWRHYGHWRFPEPPDRSTFRQQVGRVVWPWAGPAQNYLHWYPGLARLLREFRPDIIDIWEEPWGLVSAQACWLARRILPKARLLVETEQNINRVLPFPFERFRSFTLSRADHCIARSRGAADVLREKGYTGPITVVGNTVDLELFHPIDRELCRRSLGLSGFVVCCAGRLVEEKGLMDVLDALTFTSDDVNLALLGSGPLRARLEAQCRASGLLTRVRFVPALPAHELPPWLSAADVLVLASHTTRTWREQFGRVIVEAHACGTPVIGAASGAIPEVVGAGGVIVSESAPTELARAIMRLRKDTELKQRLGDLGRKQAIHRYSSQSVARQMGEVYAAISSAGHS